MNEKVNKDIYKLLDLDFNSKVYNSNIGSIIVSNEGDYVYKIYNNIKFYENEVNIYNLLATTNILIPIFYELGNIDKYFVLKLENIRKDNIRKDNLKDLNLGQVAKILYTIHSFHKNGKNLILGDIHSSNFYELNIDGFIKLGIFDFASSKYGYIEEDIANIYIDLGINNELLQKFINSYDSIIDIKRLYILTIYELYERINNGMNLSIEKRKMYYKYILIIKKNYDD